MAKKKVVRKAKPRLAGNNPYQRVAVPNPNNLPGFNFGGAVI